MAKGFLATQSSAATASEEPVQTSIASTSITTPASSSTNNAVPRNIGFDLSSLSTSKNGEEKKSWEIQSTFQEEETPLPSAPPITEQPSYNTLSITLDERSQIIAALQIAKTAVLHSRSKYDNVKALSEALQEIWCITGTVSGRMSERQANEINDEIRKIMIYRNKMKESRKRIEKITDTVNSRDCLDIFSGLIMVSRLISDVLCVILAIFSHLLYLTPLMCLLLVAVTSCMFTYFILIGYSYNNYQKIKTKSRLGKIETLYCIFYTILYGVLATLVLSLPEPGMGPAICGYVSMVTLILQRCLKCDDNSPSKGDDGRSSGSNDIMLMEVGKNITLHCNSETIVNNRESTIDQKDDSQSRIAAVEKLKIRIQSSLNEVLGERNTSNQSENNTHAINTTATVSENYSRKIVYNTVVNHNTPIHRTDDSTCFNFWMFWNTLNSHPAHYSGNSTGCCDCLSDCCSCSCFDCTCYGEGGCCDFESCCDCNEGDCCEGGCCECDGGDCCD